MAERSVKRDTSNIDPMFFIPEGLDELDYTDISVNTGDFDALATDAVGVDAADDSGLDGDTVDYSDAPGTPQILDIFSQTVRMGPTGNDVVDVVFDVDDIAGITSYELRVTKI